MTSTIVASSMDALTFEAPYLIEKLLKQRIVDSAEEGQALFTEVKRFIVLARSDDTTLWDMYSLRIDEVWHQFILFTQEYIDYCQRFFGHYVQHSPSNAPESSDTSGERVASTFVDFQNRYRDLFGVALPDVWYDEKNVTVRQRVFSDSVGTLVLQEGNGMVDLLGPNGEVVLSVNELARDALAFVTRTGAFYVRELPGDLTDEEKVALVAALVECNLLRVGP